MTMVIHDIKIKSLLRKFQSDSDDADREELYNQICELVSDFIYNYPRIKYHKDYDICSDFYIYVLERLYKILHKFNLKGKASFQTWLAVVLFNLWRNYVKSSSYKKKYEEKIRSLNMGEDPGVDRDIVLRKTVIGISDEDSESTYVGNYEVKSLKECFKRMPKKVRVVVKAHFFELFTSEDIEEAVQAFQLDFMVTLRKYEVMVNKTRDQYEKISDLIDDINSIVYDINLHKEKFKKLEKDEINNINEYSKKIERLKETKETKIEKLRSLYIKLSSKEIADFFNTNANSVSNLLHRGKNYIVDYFNEKFKEGKD